MSDITLVEQFTVELLRSDASDQAVIEAAQVSHTAIHDQTRVIDPARFIRKLVKQRHGSPFEHNYFQFRVRAPIFVAREFFRHRIGWSYNEISGRYAKLPNEFYVPGDNRPLVNIGTSMNPEFAPGSDTQVDAVQEGLLGVYNHAWEMYEAFLEGGIANEVARLCLPVGIMTEFVASCNARSLMAFLALRTSDSGASHPQWEIEQVAKEMEATLNLFMPITAAAFTEFGRVGV